ncbi:M16 family metallopeptidase [Amycolatopsis halotolerans]|uniref:M16 family metallopeptidase n=1 Tax=Amycolatopsis halotolerans TaxID=330083 RepID=A0ABV7QB22_9PSEU
MGVTDAGSGFDWPIEQLSLENGLRLVVCEDHTVPIVAVNLWYNVGSRHELTGQHGFAHLFEHLMFEGSAQVGKGEHFSVLQSVGGSGINATTRPDRTTYFQTVPSGSLATALWLEADRMGALALCQETLDNQREVVKNERRQRYDDVPYGNWFERLGELAYPVGHPYHHSIIGSMSDLSRAELSDFVHFYESFYSPDNAVLSVVGDTDPAEVRALAAKYFGGIPARTRAPAAVVPALSPQFGAPQRVELREAVPLPRLFFAFRATQFGRPGSAAEEVLCAVLGSGRASRLYRELVIERRLAQAGGEYLRAWQHAWHESILIGMATPQAGTDGSTVPLPELEQAYFDVCESVARDGVTQAELNEAKSVLVANQSRMLSTVASRADQLGRFATLFGDATKVRELLPELLAVTIDDVREAAVRVFPPSNRITLAFHPSALA